MGRERIWLIVVSVVLLVGLGVAVFWRRRAKAPAASKKNSIKETISGGEHIAALQPMPEDSTCQLSVIRRGRHSP
jgi:hypothetical protein